MDKYYGNSKDNIEVRNEGVAIIFIMNETFDTFVTLIIDSR